VAFECPALARLDRCQKAEPKRETDVAAVFVLSVVAASASSLPNVAWGWRVRLTMRWGEGRMAQIDSMSLSLSMADRGSIHSTVMMFCTNAVMDGSDKQWNEYATMHIYMRVLFDC